MSRAMAAFGGTAAVIVAAACVGSEPDIAPADRADAEASDAADGGAEPACDPDAPFGGISLVVGATLPIETTGISLTEDQLTAYVTGFELIDGDVKTSLFVAKRATTSEDFAPAAPLAGQPPGNNVIATVTPDGRELFFANFSLSEPPVPTTLADIFVAAATPAGLTGAEPVAGVNAGEPSVQETSPSLVGANVLYFVRSDENDVYKMFRAERPAGGRFAAAKEVAGFADFRILATPVVSADERTMYFAGEEIRARRPLRIYRASRDATSEPFTKIGAVRELDDGSTATPSWLTPDGCTLYFASRQRGPTERNIYRATRGK